MRGASTVPILSDSGEWRTPVKRAMNSLIAVLGTPHFVEPAPPELAEHDVEGDLYVWPSAAREDATDEDWGALEGVIPVADKLLKRWRDAGEYQGFEVWITADGDWLLFDNGWFRFEGC